MMTNEERRLAKEELQAWHTLARNCEEEFAELTRPEYTPHVYSLDEKEQELISNAVKATRTVLKNGVKREGSTRQWFLYRDACRNCDIAEYDPDVQDCISVALLALSEHEGEEEAFRTALQAINNYLYSLRAIKLDAKAQKTVYLDDLLNEGDVINVNNEINNLVTELSIQESLRPIEQKVLKLWVEGYSIAQTAEKLHLKVKYEIIDGKMRATSKAVEAHRAKIKKAIAKYYPDRI